LGEFRNLVLNKEEIQHIHIKDDDASWTVRTLQASVLMPFGLSLSVPCSPWIFWPLSVYSGNFQPSLSACLVSSS
jgi:hypothetical protein